MMKRRNRIIALVLAVCTISVSSGCHHGLPWQTTEPDHPKQHHRYVAILPAVNPPDIVNELYVRDMLKSIYDPILVGVTGVIGGLLFLVSVAAMNPQGLPIYKPTPRKKVPQGQVDEALAPLMKSLSDQGFPLTDSNVRLSGQVAAVADNKNNVAFSAPGSADLWSPVDKKLNRKAFALRGADVVVIIKIDKIGFSGTTGAYYLKSDDDPKIRFIMSGYADVIRVDDGKELNNLWLFYESSSRRISEWKRDPSAVRQEIEKAYREGSERIVKWLPDQVNYQQELEISTFASNGENCMMAPREPYVCHIYERSNNADCLRPYVRTLTPTLKWEAFPRAQDRENWPDGVLERVSDITYDLKILKDSSLSWDLVYERTGLTSAGTIVPLGPGQGDVVIHSVEDKLKADSLYVWTVRAHFKYSGREQVTEWSHFIPYGRTDGCGDKNAYPRHYYPFRTPKDVGGADLN